MAKNSSKSNLTKANAFLCANCCVEFVEVEFDFEVDGTVLHNVKALQCPRCKQEIFTPEQQKAIQERINI